MRCSSSPTLIFLVPVVSWQLQVSVVKILIHHTLCPMKVNNFNVTLPPKKSQSDNHNFSSVTTTKTRHAYWNPRTACSTTFWKAHLSPLHCRDHPTPVCFLQCRKSSPLFPGQSWLLIWRWFNSPLYYKSFSVSAVLTIMSFLFPSFLTRFLIYSLCQSPKQ